MQAAFLIGLLDKFRELADKSKILSASSLNIIKTICIVATMCLVAYDTYVSESSKHKDPTTRFVVSGKIREDLSQLREFSKAGKAFILGYHNGVSNFTRVPFVFADMQYEVVADTVRYTSDMFSNVSLDKFSFCENEIMSNEWHGTVSQLNDRRLEDIFNNTGAKFLHFSNIKDDKGIPVATVVLVWYDNSDPDAVKLNDNVIKSYIKNIRATILSYQ